MDGKFATGGSRHTIFSAGLTSVAVLEGYTYTFIDNMKTTVPLEETAISGQPGQNLGSSRSAVQPLITAFAAPSHNVDQSGALFAHPLLL